MSVPSSLALCSHLRAAACGILNCAHMLTLRRGFLPLGRLVVGTVDIMQKAIGDDDKTNFLSSHFKWIFSKAKALTNGQFIGRLQTFVELQFRFKLHFYTKKMQFEM